MNRKTALDMAAIIALTLVVAYGAWAVHERGTFISAVVFAFYAFMYGSLLTSTYLKRVHAKYNPR